MADQVEIVGEALKLLQRMEKALAQNGTTIAGGRTPPRVPVTRNNKDPLKATSRALDELGDAADGVMKRFGRLDRMMAVTIGRFGLLNKAIKGRTPAAMTQTSGIKPVEKMDEALGKLGGASGGLIKRFASLVGSGGALGFAFSKLGDLLQGPVLDAYRDTIRLQGRGISNSDNLVQFYKDAARAGMSLEEYTTLLDENAVAVSRSTSFKAFNDQLESTTNRLGYLGVIGSDARKLSASILSSATTLGIPQAQLGNVMQSQISVFEQLRKTTMMTAEGFKELMADVSGNVNVQEQLLGLAPDQRASALLDLTKTAALGKQMGLTAQQSKSLADALLAQRKMTAVDRFKAAGVLRMGGAITGMEAGQTEELATLALKKNRTDEENARFVELGGQYKQRLEEMANSGNIQAEHIYDQLSGLLPGTTGQQVDAAGLAKLTTDSGKVVNADFGKKVTAFGKSVDDFATIITGFRKNPLGEAVTQLIPLIGTLLGYLAFTRKIGSLLGTAKGVDKAGAVSDAVGSASNVMTPGTKKPPTGVIPKAVAPVSAKQTGIMRRAIPTFMAAGDALANVGRSGINYVQTFKAIAQDGGLTKMELIAQEGSAAIKGLMGVAKNGVSGVGNIVKGGFGLLKGLKGVFLAGGPIGVAISAAFGFFEELFTGEMTNALGLGDGIFGRMLGAVVAGFNGILTGVTRLFDDAMNWLFEGLGIDFKFNTTKLVDYVTSLLFDFYKMIGSLFMKGLASVLEVLPFVKKDAPFIKKLRENADEVDSSIIKSSANREEMWNTEGATLRSVGEKNLKAQNNIQQKTEDSARRTAVASGKIVDGIDSLAGAAQRTVDSAQAAAKTTQVATPGQPERAAVTPPEVNKTQVEGTADKTTSVGKDNKPTLVNAPDVVAILQQQLELQRALLVRLAEAKVGEDVQRLVASTLPSTSELTPFAYGA